MNDIEACSAHATPNNNSNNNKTAKMDRLIHIMVLFLVFEMKLQSLRIEEAIAGADESAAANAQSSELDRSQKEGRSGSKKHKNFMGRVRVLTYGETFYGI
jgi:hypothetical protein